MWWGEGQCCHGRTSAWHALVPGPGGLGPALQTLAAQMALHMTNSRSDMHCHGAALQAHTRVEQLPWDNCLPSAFSVAPALAGHCDVREDLVAGAAGRAVPEA